MDDDMAQRDKSFSGHKFGSRALIWMNIISLERSQQVEDNDDPCRIILIIPISIR